MEADAGNKIGPNLNGLFGRHTGQVEGFSYTDANKNKDIKWDSEMRTVSNIKSVFCGHESEALLVDVLEDEAQMAKKWQNVLLRRRVCKCNRGIGML